MRWLINRYSYVIFSAVAIGGATLLGSRLGALAGSAVVVGVGAALAAAQAKLSGDSSAATWSMVQDLVHGTMPVLLFVYSDT